MSLNKSAFGLENLKNAFQDCHINFLIGSGMSASFVPTLGNIEVLLTEVEKVEDSSKRKIIRASLYKKYFDDVISKNLDLVTGASVPTAQKDYENFLQLINTLMHERRITLRSRQANIFTTNIDILIEKAIEHTGVENNDGFSGRFDLRYDQNNFKKTFFRRSPHYDNKSELPSFNLIKLHGSLTWKNENAGNGSIEFSKDLNLVKSVKDFSLPVGSFIPLAGRRNHLISTLETAAERITFNASIDTFSKLYEAIPIVNPTKEKFKTTLLNHIYYDLLRIFTNELEKENTLLFVMGFSFADEHIRDLAVRAANSNPTLLVCILARNESSVARYEHQFSESHIRNKNIRIITPLSWGHKEEDGIEFDLKNINKSIFEKLLRNVVGRLPISSNEADEE